MIISPIRHYRQRRLTKVFLEESFKDGELVFKKLVYGCREDYSFNIIVTLHRIGMNKSRDGQLKIDDTIKDYVKIFSLFPRFYYLKHKEEDVVFEYSFMDLEFNDYKNEVLKDLEEFLQFCSDSHLEDETEISYNPKYEVDSSFEFYSIQIIFDQRDDLKEKETFSTLFIKMLTNSVISGKLKILSVCVRRLQISIFFKIVVYDDLICV
jgi:hypothetical protein